MGGIGWRHVAWFDRWGMLRKARRYAVRKVCRLGWVQAWHKLGTVGAHTVGVGGGGMAWVLFLSIHPPFACHQPLAWQHRTT